MHQIILINSKQIQNRLHKKYSDLKITESNQNKEISWGKKKSNIEN